MHYKLTTTHLHRPHRRLLTTWSITSRLEVHHPLNNLLARWAHLVLATAVVIMPTTITIVCCPVHRRTQQRMWQPANRRPNKPKLIVGMSSRGIITWSPSKPLTENHRVRVARVKYSSLLLTVMEELWTVLLLIMVSVSAFFFKFIRFCELIISFAFSEVWSWSVSLYSEISSRLCVNFGPFS